MSFYVAQEFSFTYCLLGWPKPRLIDLKIKANIVAKELALPCRSSKRTSTYCYVIEAMPLQARDLVQGVLEYGERRIGLVPVERRPSRRCRSARRSTSTHCPMIPKPSESLELTARGCIPAFGRRLPAAARSLAARRGEAAVIGREGRGMLAQK